MTAILNLGYVLARRRLMSSFRMELTVLLGVTLAVVLLSSAVVFNDLLAETALRRALADAESSDVNFWVRVFNDLDDPRTATPASDRYLTSRQFVAQRVLPPLGDAVGAVSFQVETATFYFTGRPNLDLPNDVRPRGRMQYISGLRDGKAELVQGRWPGVAGDGGYDDTTGDTEGIVVEIVVDALGLEFLDLELGEGFEIVPATGGDNQPSTRVVVSTGTAGTSCWLTRTTIGRSFPCSPRNRHCANRSVAVIPASTPVPPGSCRSTGKASPPNAWMSCSGNSGGCVVM